MSGGIEQAWDRIGSRLDEIDTPALLVDGEVLERNVERMAAFGRHHGVGIQPHAKAHKTPLIAHMQMHQGALGVCCQKVGEAEVMVAGGIDDVLLTSEVVGAPKLARLVRLARHARITVALDNIAAAEALSEAAVTARVNVGGIVEIDVGQGRCGVPPGQPAASLAEQVARLPALRLFGIQGYQGALQHVLGYRDRKLAAGEANGRLMETRALFKSRGLPLEIVTGAGTGTYEFEGAVAGMSDIQPGSYIFMDAQYRGIGGRSGPVYDDFEPSLAVLATVISTVKSDRLVIDAGLKAVSTDAGRPSPIDLEGWEYQPAGDEHGLLVRCGDGPRLSLGEKVRLLPSHCDTTVNLYSSFHLIRNGLLDGIWSVLGRGRSQ